MTDVQEKNKKKELTFRKRIKKSDFQKVNKKRKATFRKGTKRKNRCLDSE